MLRLATPADDAFLRRLFAETDAELQLLPPALRDPLLAMQFNARQLSWAAAYPAAQNWLLCAEDGEPAGRLLAARRGSAESCRVIDLAVLPAYQRQGLAVAALREAQAWAAEDGVALTLRVVRTNTAAQQLYRAAGFHVSAADEIALEMTWYAARPQEAA